MPQSRRVTDAVWSSQGRSSTDSQVELEAERDTPTMGIFDRIRVSRRLDNTHWGANPKREQSLSTMSARVAVGKSPSPAKTARSRTQSTNRSTGSDNKRSMSDELGKKKTMSDEHGKKKSTETSDQNNGKSRLSGNLAATQNTQEPSEVAVDRELEKTLQAMEGYHGYLPREDIASLLTAPGDYLIRVSETENEDDTPGQSSKMKQIIVSVKTENPLDPGKDLVNLIIRQKQNKYYIHPKKQFDTIAEVIEDNKKKPRKLGAKGTTYQMLKPVPLAKWEFKHCDVKLCDKELGRGAFGVVVLGELTRINGEQVKVAIKSSKGVVDLTKEQIKELMNEARLVRGFKSVHVVKTFGVAVDEQPLYIIIEFVEGTSLDKYLLTSKNTLTLADRLTMTLGAARGLHYCHTRNLVHCDISARNCLIVVANKLVKISDFGLSAPLKPGEVLSRKNEKKAPKLPVKWLSPETLQELKFTHKSDVYTFGILMYEIMSSSLPYMGMENKEVKPLVLAGRAPDLPNFVPQKMVSFYQERITIKDEEKRATMDEICIALAAFGAQDAGV